MWSADTTQNTYLIDIEEGAETARLIEQDILFNRAQGGLFPEGLDLSQMENVLDLGCGPGGWALEVAYTYKHLGVIGVDVNPNMMRYAFAEARTRGLENISFEVMDVRQPLEFQEASFDLINARFIAGFMDRASWPLLLLECLRLLKPGGIIRLTEMETSSSSSASLDRLNGYLYQALQQQKRSFSVNGRSIGVAYMLGKLLQDAGFQKIRRFPFINDSSHGAELHYSTTKDIEVLYPLIKPYLINSGIVDEPTFDAEYKTMLIDMLGTDYVSLGFGLIVVAQKGA
ncbi:class I SAM-dependent methyltransferase [Dictyobacter kobayashii]|nr:class I SAM-dependent methyltransferase [Dictyobacter kobayashii]